MNNLQQFSVNAHEFISSTSCVDNNSQQQPILNENLQAITEKDHRVK